MRLTIIIVWVLLLMPLCSAHVPRLVPGEASQIPVVVENPEHSQAFYGCLTGAPHLFTLQSSDSFQLYVNILVPEVMGARIDFVAEITRDATVIKTLSEGSWNHFYEWFAGDNYIRGPEFEQAVEPGTYIIRISNEDNHGYYILAIGKKERFPPNEIINTYRLLPLIKEEFFHKSPLTAYFNLFTLLLIALVMLFVWLIIGGVRFVRRLWTKK